LRARLKLTPDQEQQVMLILRDGAAKAKDLRTQAQAAATPRERRNLLRDAQAAREDIDKKLGAVLSADQMAEYHKFRDEQKEAALKKKAN
jgi:hypothetical protein